MQRNHRRSRTDRRLARKSPGSNELTQSLNRQEQQTAKKTLWLCGQKCRLVQALLEGPLKTEGYGWSPKRTPRAIRCCRMIMASDDKH
jgi:hypothetical protein